MTDFYIDSVTWPVLECVTWPVLECVMQSQSYANSKTGALLFVPCHLVAGIKLWKSSVFAAVWLRLRSSGI
jgi:hypothetical protein